MAKYEYYSDDKAARLLILRMYFEFMLAFPKETKEFMHNINSTNPRLSLLESIAKVNVLIKDRIVDKL